MCACWPAAAAPCLLPPAPCHLLLPLPHGGFCSSCCCCCSSMSAPRQASEFSTILATLPLHYRLHRSTIVCSLQDARCSQLQSFFFSVWIFQPCLDLKKFSNHKQSQRTSDKTCCRPVSRIFSFTLDCCSALAHPPPCRAAGRNHLQTLLLPTCRKYC